MLLTLREPLDDCLQDAIGKAVASAGQKTIVATKKGIDYAQLANRGGVQPFMFDTGAKRRLQQNSASYQRSDRMQFAGLATQVGGRNIMKHVA
jgi:hypothetical protein